MSKTTWPAKSNERSETLASKSLTLTSLHFSLHFLPHTYIIFGVWENVKRKSRSESLISVLFFLMIQDYIIAKQGLGSRKRTEISDTSITLYFLDDQISYKFLLFLFICARSGHLQENIVIEVMWRFIQSADWPLGQQAHSLCAPPAGPPHK